MFNSIIKELKVTKSSADDEEKLRKAFLSLEEGYSNAGLLDAKEIEHILTQNGEPLKAAEVDELFKLVNLQNNRDIDYEGTL